jgi:hypothetical protein
MGWSLWDLAGVLAAVRGGKLAEQDGDPHFLRARVASVLWMPGLLLAIVAGELAASYVVGSTAFALLVGGLLTLIYPVQAGRLARAVLRKG